MIGNGRRTSHHLCVCAFALNIQHLTRTPNVLPTDVCREQITQLCDGSPGTQRMLAAFLITFSLAVFLWLFFPGKKTLSLAAAHSEPRRRFDV